MKSGTCKRRMRTRKDDAGARTMDGITVILDHLAQASEGWARIVWSLVGLALGLSGLAFVVLTLAVRQGHGHVTEARLLGAV